ncbi:hypothetical protein Tco_1047825 [Tanacetum coccineum]
MVAYLKKIDGSKGFHQIVDFLNVSHIRYALTKNPTIYVSLLNQFWQTATTRTLDNGEIEIIATIDGKGKIVTEASIRRHLKLEDSDGINSLPTTKIFEQLSLMGNMKRASKGFTGEDIPLFPRMIVQGPVESMVPQPKSPTQTPIADEAASTGVDDRYGVATTTVTILEAGQGSGNIDKTPTMPHDSPLLRVNTLGSDKGNMTLQELMGRKIDEIDQDLDITLVQHDVEIQGRYDQDMEFNFDFDAAKEVSTAEKEVSTAEPVSTAGAKVTTASVAVSTANPT